MMNNLIASPREAGMAREGRARNTPRRKARGAEEAANDFAGQMSLAGSVAQAIPARSWHRPDARFGKTSSGHAASSGDAARSGDKASAGGAGGDLIGGAGGKLIGKKGEGLAASAVGTSDPKSLIPSKRNTGSHAASAFIAGLKPGSPGKGGSGKAGLVQGTDPMAFLRELLSSPGANPRAVMMHDRRGEAELAMSPTTASRMAGNPESVTGLSGLAGRDGLALEAMAGQNALGEARRSEAEAILERGGEGGPDGGGAYDFAGKGIGSMLARDPSQARPGMVSGGEFLGTLSAIRGARAESGGPSGARLGEAPRFPVPGQALASGVMPMGALDRALPNQALPNHALSNQAFLDRASHGVIEGESGRERKALAEGSTDDGSAKLAAAASSGGLSGTSHGSVASTPVVVEGRVTQGAMARDRLSSESLAGVSAGIRNLSPHGGGEIRIRLNPGSLGELHLRVMTNGSQVRLQIHASDEKARRILESSIGSLSESLARHQLHLGAVDFTVAGLGQAQGGEMRNDPGQSQARHQQAHSSFQQAFEGRMGQSGQNGRGGQGPGGERDRGSFEPGIHRVASTGGRALAGGAASRRPLRPGDGRRLDVRA